MKVLLEVFPTIEAVAAMIVFIALIIKKGVPSLRHFLVLAVATAFAPLLFLFGWSFLGFKRTYEMFTEFVKPISTAAS